MEPIEICPHCGCEELDGPLCMDCRVDVDEYAGECEED